MARRMTVPVLALLFLLSLVTSISSQATSAAQAPAPSASPAKWVTPMKGDGTIDVVKGTSRRVGNDMVTTLKVKNTSKGPLALLTVEEYWYPATGTDIISGDTQRYKSMIAPGEIVEITTKSPYKAGMTRNIVMFKHANGKIKATQVPKFVEPKK